MDAADPLSAYDKRRRPPMDTYRRHRPIHGGAGHLRPDEPRVLEEWNAFAYRITGTTPDLATAQAWTNELRVEDGPA
ncbi:DUF6087 family protein [Streptomyces marincola]|uniref:DUF6087 family protein n=1 Tax=Streptomyces marincola TaxID=2878388 RepID=UPI001CF0ED34|nr:DUF6087 family protein [Streptomyces marincola]UCM88217.1 DUF6087 family protein [Streptomyces marincola]